jgi:hypothetical protein
MNWNQIESESDSRSRLPSNRLPAGGTIVLNGSHMKASVVVPCSLVHTPFFASLWLYLSQ